MADNRTMAELLQAPTEGYEDAIVILEITANNFELKHARIWLEKEPPRSILTWDDLVSKFINQFFPPSKTTNLRNQITRFQQRFDESFYEAWDRFNDLLRACPHHGFSELHQLDTFYNALNVNDQDSLNSDAGGNFLDKLPRECLKIFESKSNVSQSRAKAVVAKVSTSFSTPAISSEVVELKDMVRALLLNKKNQSSTLVSSSTPAPVKAVEPNCVTCGGTHSYQNCPATSENVYRDNIQEYVSQAVATNYNQGNNGFRPQKVANQIRPPGFPPHQNNQNNFNRGNNFNQNRGGNLNQSNFNQGGNFNQGQLLRPQVNQPPAYQAPIPQTQRMDECLALADLGAGINLMPLFVWEALLLPELTSTCMTLELVDRSVSKPIGIAKDVSFNVGVFHFPADFVIVDFKPDPRVLLILGRCFLNTGRALIDVHKDELTLRIRNETITYNLDQTLKDLPPHLEYAFLEGDNKLPIIIAKELGDEEKSVLINILKSHKRAIAWKLSDIQGKDNVHYPYGMFAYRRMPFGLCNAPGTFQRCMLAIFHDMVEKTMEVFMDNFSVFGNSFKNYLSHLDKMLQRCEDTNLSLNWEKSHFMVKEGIVLGRKISKNGIEVDRAKVDVITKLPHPTAVKEKTYGSSNLDCPKLGLPFELMCDASNFTIGAVLGQRHEKHFKPIHYASKTMNDAETNYTTTEKEMLALVYAFEKFRSYLIMNKSIVHTDHAAFKYLFAKKDAKARFLRWVLLLQEFDFKDLDTKGAENLAADHLSRLENPYENVLDPKEINETFPLETLSMVTFRGDSSAPRFADFANYHASNFIVK
nr:retrovirus-related Pol polyprotein from transposon 17.6 [Tanacetum cinerariifolium]